MLLYLEGSLADPKCRKLRWVPGALRGRRERKDTEKNLDGRNVFEARRGGGSSLDLWRVKLRYGWGEKEREREGERQRDRERERERVGETLSRRH